MYSIEDLWWSQVGLSDYIKKEILLKAGDCKRLYEADTRQYLIWGLTSEGIQKIEKGKQNLERCKSIEAACHQAQIEIISFLDPLYPWQLREIPDAPMVLYAKGQVKQLSEPMISVVGSRKCSEYGEQIATKLGEELTTYGLCVTSGMAMGIDSAAHFGALQQGSSVAVLGTGVDRCYPACNQQLYRKLLQDGCIISEYPPDTPPRAYHFPKRNRIISGMSYGTVVVEAAERSGSLITASLAFDYEREVFAVPGNITRALSQGANTLLNRGAHCVVSVENIIQELPQGLCIKCKSVKKNRNKLHIELAQEERIVYASVSQEPIIFEKILKNTQLSYESVNTSLLHLEVKGLIQRLSGERYVRI